MIKEKREKSGLNAGASNTTTIKEETIDTSHNKAACKLLQNNSAYI